MGILNRLFNIGQAEAHSVVDKLENPIKLTEQGIRNLKSDLDKALRALAEIKALAIRSRKDIETFQSQASNYEKKAMQLLEEGQAGSIATEEADRLASEALKKREEAIQNRLRSTKEKQKFEANIETMQSNISKLKSQLSHYENELNTLKARAKVSKATKNINQQLSKIDSSSTVSMLERMKEKVEQEEALAESYGEIANENRSIDDEIDTALSASNKTSTQNDLAALKKKMGMDK